jgi:phosphoribosylformylglycinamidine synthase
MHAVAEACRNVACTGAKPVAATNCLNFGNPEKPLVAWQFTEAVHGLAEACRTLGIPVVSGNVSLYNESHDSAERLDSVYGEQMGRRRAAIYPTPVIGMVGLIDDYGRCLQAGFRAAGDFVLLIGPSGNDFGGSEYAKIEHGVVAGQPPALDLTQERVVHELVLAANDAGLLRSAHDVAEGGMLVALAECCLLGGIGIRCPALKPDSDLRLDAAFFGESQGRFIVSVASRAMPELQTIARRHHVEIQLLGLTGGDHIEFEGQLRLGLDELERAWQGGLN